MQKKIEFLDVVGKFRYNYTEKNNGASYDIPYYPVVPSGSVDQIFNPTKTL